MINFTLLALVVLLGASGDVCVTRGMKMVGEISSFRPRALVDSILRVMRCGPVWLGILCKAAAFFSFLALLSRAELSWAVPAAASTFIVDTLAAKYLLKERITGLRWAGTLCVGLGVALISL